MNLLGRDHLTYREIQIWIEADREKHDMLLDALAWQIQPAVNVHIPKGKPNLSFRKMRPGRIAAERDVDLEDEWDDIQDEIYDDPVDREMRRTIDADLDRPGGGGDDVALDLETYDGSLDE